MLNARNGRALIVGFAALSVACASGQGQGARMGDPDLILREEIDESTAQNVYDLVQRVRPQWLRTRGLTTLRQAAGEEDIVIYMDNARLGYRDALRRVPLAGIAYMEFFSASRATQRWGSGHIHGAILISTQER